MYRIDAEVEEARDPNLVFLAAHRCNALPESPHEKSQAEKRRVIKPLGSFFRDWREIALYIGNISFGERSVISYVSIALGIAP